MVTQEAKTLIALLQSALYGTPAPVLPQSLDSVVLYRLACHHAVEAMAYCGLKAAKVPLPDEVLTRFRESYRKRVAQDTIKDYAMEQILNAFEAAGIDCMPLKGYVIRRLYPQTEMRYLSDFDLLVKSDQIEKCRRVMLELGYQVHRYDSHHDIFYSLSPMMNVELHKFLIVGELQKYFGVGFERAIRNPSKKHVFALSTEDYYIYILGHMAYHFAHGGIGIRSLVDIRVYLDRYEQEMDMFYVKKELAQCGLLRFAEELSHLSASWFLDEPQDALLQQLSSYIVNSQMLGTPENSRLSEAAKQYRRGETVAAAKTKAVARMIVPNQADMEFSYTVLRKAPWLRPFCDVHRWLTILFHRKKNISRLFKTAGASQEDILQVKELYQKLEIDHL